MTDLPLSLAVVIAVAVVAALALGAGFRTRRRGQARRDVEARTVRRRTTIQPADDPILRAMGLGPDQSGSGRPPESPDASNPTETGAA